MSGISESIAALAAAVPAPGRLAEQRAAALDAFSRHGLPGTTEENWRYTDISALDSEPLSFQAPADVIAPQIEMLPCAGDRIVFANGQLIDSLTEIESPTDAGISVLGTDWDALTDGFPGIAAVLQHPLGQLNTAAARHGVLIRTPAGHDTGRTINIELAHSGDAALALQPRIVLDLGENSDTRVVLHYSSDTRASGWMNTVIEIRQARGSKLELVQLQEHSLSLTQTVLVSATLDRDATASIAAFDLGGKLARNDIAIRLDGPGSEVEVYGAFLPMHDQHIDTQVSIDHAAAHTRSLAVFRGIAGTRSRGVFNGKVIVRPDAQKISAEQRSDNLLLSGDAEIDTKPELEIYADDVKCAHGATVGDLDEQQLFYLRSRGIDDAAARALLTWAFAKTVVERIRDDALRSVIAARIAERLPEHERWEDLN